MQRREMLLGLGSAAAVSTAAQAGQGLTLDPMLPEGTREEAILASPPGKSRLIRLADRPMNYETQVQAFRDAITPNEQFFVRYHLTDVPNENAFDGWKLEIAGTKTVRLSMTDLKDLPQTDVTAVCQCSGNRRGLFQPHVAGVQWGLGAMGCATWRGPRLRDVLAKAGVAQDAIEIWLDGADGPALPTTPDFRKSVPMKKAVADETIVAIAMNGAPLPLTNGFPARLVVGGWTATYWVKHLSRVEVSSKPLDSFWMQKAYRVPAGMFPVNLPFASQNKDTDWPITEMVVNSVIAEPLAGDQVARSGFTVRGVAWDRGSGISRVDVSLDGGKTWRNALLDQNLGPYAFRRFTLNTGSVPRGKAVLAVRATSNAKETQATVLKQNPAGYQNNVPHLVPVTVA
jgi:sulfite dehydrogenase (cytochrome) subunit A